jgi:hypothetical protein
MSAAVRKLTKANAAAGSAVESMKAELSQLASRREELVAEREQILSAPVDRASAEARVADLVETLATGVDRPGGSLIDPAGYKEVLRELTALPITAGPVAQPATSPWSVMAAVAPELLRQALLRQVAEAYGRSPEPLTAEARRAALAKIDKELQAVEAAAASLWWQADDVGISLPLPAIGGEALAGLAA